MQFVLLLRKSELMNYMEELQEAYEKNLLIPVIGSGLSVPFGLPTWGDLIINIADEYSIRDCIKCQIMSQLSNKKYLDAIDLIKNEDVSEQEICIRVAECLKNAKKMINASDIDNNYIDLLKFHRSRFITTNYDEYLDEITECAEMPLKVFAEMNVNEFARDKYNGRIIPLHGTISKPESIVFSRASYIDNYDDIGFEQAFQLLRSQYTFLFLGFSFDDIYFKKMFDKIIHRFNSHHFILLDRKQARNNYRIKRLEDKYNVSSIFYDADGDNHVQGIRELLERIVEFYDDGIIDMPRRRISSKKEPCILWPRIDDCEKHASKYEVQPAIKGYLSIYQRKDFGELPPTVRAEIYRGLIFCYGVQRKFDEAEMYVDKALNELEISDKNEELLSAILQMLFNSMEWEKAYKLIFSLKKKDICFHFFGDVIECAKLILGDRPLGGKRFLIYENLDISAGEKEFREKLYERFKSKYVIKKKKCFELKNEEQYNDDYGKEFVFYWMGTVAGQLFHEHNDAVVLLYQAYRMHPITIYQAELGRNYLALAISKVRYQQNSEIYDIDQESAKKAIRSFELVINDTDKCIRLSMIKSCGRNLLMLYNMLNFDFKFEQNYKIFARYLEHDQNLLMMKAEHDARYNHKIDYKIIKKFSDRDRIFIESYFNYFEANLDYQLGKIERRDYHSGKVIQLLTDNTKVKNKEINKENRFVLMKMDAAFNIRNLKIHAQCRHILEKRGDSNKIYHARELEMMGNMKNAEKMYKEGFKEKPNRPLFMIVKAFYLRNRMYNKLESFYETIISDYPYMVDDDLYVSYIHFEMISGRICKMFNLYLRFQNKIRSPLYRKEISEMMSSIACDYSDPDDRCTFIKNMLQSCPQEGKEQYYNILLKLYSANFRFCDALNVIKDAEKYMDDEWINGERFDMNYLANTLAYDGKIAVTPYELLNTVIACSNMEKKAQTESKTYTLRCLGCIGKMVILPINVIILMIACGRENELLEIKRVYISYASVIFIQDNILKTHDPILFKVQSVLKSASNVRFFAPKLEDFAIEYGNKINPWIEGIQIDAFAKEHPKIKKVMRKWAILT